MAPPPVGNNASRTAGPAAASLPPAVVVSPESPLSSVALYTPRCMAKNNWHAAVTAESQIPKAWEVTFPNVYGPGCMARVTAVVHWSASHVRSQRLLSTTTYHPQAHGDDLDTVHLPNSGTVQPANSRQQGSDNNNNKDASVNGDGNDNSKKINNNDYNHNHNHNHNRNHNHNHNHNHNYDHDDNNNYNNNNNNAT
ncbi:hypothetical protein EDB89DRAFT_1910790 [Lactarius sanguifluus]|nr:hypothetical protein EDB89DRAFT_1910790 [Lactarius sanguifluus]